MALASSGITNSSALAQTARFKADVDQVIVYAAVYDGTGQLVSTLTKEDFEVYENKMVQEVTYFGLDDVPSTDRHRHGYQREHEGEKSSSWTRPPSCFWN